MTNIFRFEHAGGAADGEGSPANVYLPPEPGLIIKPENPTPAAGKKSRPANFGRDAGARRYGAAANQARAIHLQMDWSKLDLVVFAKTPRPPRTDLSAHRQRAARIVG